MKNIIHFLYTKVILITIIVINSCNVMYAQSYKEVSMLVGETQTFYLPTSITSKNLKSVTFYSNGINYVRVISYTNYSVTVKAMKAFSSPIIVRCDYRYFVKNGSYTYETKGAYDYRIDVKDNNADETEVKPTSINFSSTVKAIDVGESIQLTPTVLPVNAKYTLTWSISDNSVASISQDGLLTGKSEGAADLKVKTQNGIYTMLRVVVSKPAPTSVSVKPSTLSIIEGESKYLSATVLPSHANQSVTWSSSDPTVATISSTGKVTALRAGTATISARSSNGKLGTCTITCKSAIPTIVLSDKDGNVNLPTKANIQYERTLYRGWNSVCVPFAITKTMINKFISGCVIVKPVEIEIIGNTKVLSVIEVTSVDAGNACLIYVPKDVVCYFALNNVFLNSKPDDSSIIKGVYLRTIIGKNIYKLNNDGSTLGVTRTENAIVGPYRAYINLEQGYQTRTKNIPIDFKVTQIKY